MKSRIPKLPLLWVNEHPHSIKLKGGMVHITSIQQSDATTSNKLQSNRCFFERKLRQRKTREYLPIKQLKSEEISTLKWKTFDKWRSQYTNWSSLTNIFNTPTDLLRALTARLQFQNSKSCPNLSICNLFIRFYHVDNSEK